MILAAQIDTTIHGMWQNVVLNLEAWLIGLKPTAEFITSL